MTTLGLRFCQHYYSPSCLYGDYSTKKRRENMENTMIEDLVSTLSVSNAPWNAWELEFIESLEDKEYKDLSVKQREVVERLWDKL
jgi:hypothetical protein